MGSRYVNTDPLCAECRGYRVMVAGDICGACRSDEERRAERRLVRIRAACAVGACIAGVVGALVWLAGVWGR